MKTFEMQVCFGGWIVFFFFADQTVVEYRYTNRTPQMKYTPAAVAWLDKEIKSK